MALLTSTGRSSSFIYGTQPIFTFNVKFPSPSMTSTSPLNTNSPIVNTNKPTTGTLTVAGVTVTLVASDLESVQSVVAKIKATSISGYTVAIDSYDTTMVKLVSTTIGPVTAPTVVLGTATNIYFTNQSFTQGVLCGTGAMDDIYIGGRVPCNLTIATTSATAAVSTSTGTLLEQQMGTLTYGTALSFTNGVATITAPVNFVRVTTSGVSAPSQVKLYITR